MPAQLTERDYEILDRYLAAIIRLLDRRDGALGARASLLHLIGLIVHDDDGFREYMVETVRELQAE